MKKKEFIDAKKFLGVLSLNADIGLFGFTTRMKAQGRIKFTTNEGLKIN